MKILENRVNPTQSKFPQTIICRHCGSRLIVDESDIKKGDAFYSEREIDHGVKGFDCPCCGEFNAV